LIFMMFLIKQKRKLFNRRQNNHTKNLANFLGDFILIPKYSFRVTPRQYDTSKRLLELFFKKQTKFWYYVLPKVLITKKAKETRLGRGKGNSVSLVINLIKNQPFLSFQNNCFSNQIEMKLVKKPKAKYSKETKILSKTLRWIF